MGILRAIGRFFAKIGRWIRDTAWVQPLLIVGGIFALIFSIPYIVDGVKAAFDSGNASETYYYNHRISLNGSEKDESDADKLLDYIVDKYEGRASQDDTNKYGTKFYLSFVQKGCVGCETVQPGFETLEKEWNSGEFKPTNSGEKFKLYTIFIDEETDDTLTGTDTSFKKYFWYNHAEFFENAATAVEDRPYFSQQGGSSSNYADLLQKIDSATDFQTPTTFLIDFDNIESPTWTYGISDILFNFEPKGGNESSYGYARTLMECWNHTGIFNGEDK